MSTAAPAGGEIAFGAFGAVVYEEERPVLLRIERYPYASMKNWVHFLRGGALTGQPPRVVTDVHDATIDAARNVLAHLLKWKPTSSRWRYLHSEAKLNAASYLSNPSCQR